MTVNLLSSEQCCGCAACLDCCPVHAISMIEDESWNRRASVDESICIKCGLCTKVCPHFNKEESTSIKKLSYVSFCNDKEFSKKSSSGGIFAAIAREIICHGGIVYGAAMIVENNGILCKHIRVDSLENLPLLQGSKYVQSRTDGIFMKVKKDLSEGKTVLFSGTSCQIASLKRFVGERGNLFTIDLVCHGVPKNKLFHDYITFLGKKYKCETTNISFRGKGRMYLGKEMRFILSLQFRNKKSEAKSIYIQSMNSAYYNLYLKKAGYRDSCYHCAFATLHKPGDLTLGDFIPREMEKKIYGFSSAEHYSSIIVHNEKGEAMLEKVDRLIRKVQIPMDEMIKHHPNLSVPSVVSPQGELYLKHYVEGGYDRLQDLVERQFRRHQIKNILRYCFSAVKKSFIHKR